MKVEGDVGWEIDRNTGGWKLDWIGFEVGVEGKGIGAFFFCVC